MSARKFMQIWYNVHLPRGAIAITPLVTIEKWAIEAVEINVRFFEIVDLAKIDFLYILSTVWPLRPM